MSAAAPQGFANLPSYLGSGNADPGGGYLFAYNGQPQWLDSGGNLWQLTAPGSMAPGDGGFLAWNFDPGLAAAGTALTTATINLARVNIRTPTVVNNVWFQVSGAAVTVTASENFAGIYSSAGALLGSSAAASLDTKITSTGTIEQALTGPVNLGPGFYWVALLFTASGTMPTLTKAPNSATLGNAGGSAAAYRWATAGTGTTLPSTITPASNVLTNAQAIWAGLS